MVALRILLGTNQLERLSGSEIITLEFAEYFCKCGYDVTVFSNWKALPIRSQFKKIDIPIETEPSAIRPFHYDMIYFQHHVAGLFDYSPHPDDRKASTFVFGHLSPTGFWESGGWAHESVLADLTLANSQETAEALACSGLGVPVRVFHNAAPDTFHAKRPALRRAPRRILIVSNHNDPSLLEAAEILKDQLEVLHIGRTGEKVARITQNTIRGVDIVVTIGKTVQYALAVGTPVYVYDRFGGPGYLTSDTFDLASARNFSGRGCGQQLNGAALAADILGRYHEGRDFALSLGEVSLAPFRLSTHLQALADFQPSPNHLRRERMAARGPDIERERLLAAFARSAYVRERGLDAKVRRLIEQNRNSP